MAVEKVVWKGLVEWEILVWIWGGTGTAPSNIKGL